MGVNMKSHFEQRSATQRLIDKIISFECETPEGLWRYESNIECAGFVISIRDGIYSESYIVKSVYYELISDVVSWENNQSIYSSLEAFLNQKYLIQ